MTDIQPLELNLEYDPQMEPDRDILVECIKMQTEKINELVEELNRLNEKVGRYGMGE